MLIFLAFFAMHLFYWLFFVFFTTTFPFPCCRLVVSAHSACYLDNFISVLAHQLMSFEVLFENKMKRIVVASCVQMPNFLPIFAAIDVKHELLLGKDVIAVERTSCLLVILSLFEHPPNYYNATFAITALSQQSFYFLLKEITFPFSHLNFRALVRYLYHMEIKIPDDPTEVKQIFEELKNNFYLNTVQKVEFRQKALAQLIKGYKELQPQIDEALKYDCGYNPFMANFVAHNLTLTEVEHLQKNLRKWAKPRPVDTPVTLGLASSQVEYEPLGVALVLSAWNYPIYTAVPQVAAAISAGNCVILKPSELAPYTSNILKKLFEKYMDPRFYRVIEGKVQVAKTLTKQKFDIICFTGSTETGRLVAIQAAKNLTPCILELGGKCPVIVDETANLKSAAIRIIFGKYINSGQTCIAADHIYIHQKVYKQFRKILLEEIKNAFDHQDNSKSGDYGKINNMNHLKKLENMLKDQHGGSVIYGGKIIEERMHFPPTIVQQPKKDSELMKQEIFGPIMPIFPYSNLKDVIQELRTRGKPLIVYCFSQNKSNIEYVKTHTYSGSFVVNDVIIQMLNNHLPFGGVGQSGYGRYHGESGFIGFSNPKSLCYTKAFNAYPLSTRFFPYDDSKKRVLTFLFKTSNLTYSQLKRGSGVLALIIAGAVGYLKLRPLL